MFCIMMSVSVIWTLFCYFNKTRRLRDACNFTFFVEMYFCLLAEFLKKLWINFHELLAGVFMWYGRQLCFWCGNLGVYTPFWFFLLQAELKLPKILAWFLCHFVALSEFCLNTKIVATSEVRTTFPSWFM